MMSGILLLVPDPFLFPFFILVTILDFVALLLFPWLVFVVISLGRLAFLALATFLGFSLVRLFLAVRVFLVCSPTQRTSFISDNKKLPTRLHR